MKTNLFRLTVILLSLAFVPSSSAQDNKPANPATAPPKLLLLVHQEFQSGKAGERHKLGVAISRACDRLTVPNSWIDLQSLTGASEAVSFDPFESFAQLDTAFAGWGQILATHPDLARLQGELKTIVSRESTIIAVRRDDLGYRSQSIDFSKARFMRVLQVHLRPGHESDFVEAFRILGAAYEKIDASTPWVVYQVNVGLPTPAFLVFVPMRALQQNDNLLSWRKDLREAEGEEAAHRLEQIAREAYESTESNLYAVSPETSHVSSEFAAGDPAFWSPKPPAAAKPPVPKSRADKPK